MDCVVPYKNYVGVMDFEYVSNEICNTYTKLNGYQKFIENNGNYPNIISEFSISFNNFIETLPEYIKKCVNHKIYEIQELIRQYIFIY